MRVFDPSSRPDSGRAAAASGFRSSSPGHPDTRRPHPRQQRHGSRHDVRARPAAERPLQDSEATEERGSRVKAPKAGDMLPVAAGTPRRSTKRDDLLDIRELVEANAAGLAANAQDVDRRRIRQAFEALDAAFTTDDLETQIERDLAFHISIIEATHDPALRKVGDAIIQLMYGHIRRNLSGLTPNPDRRNALRRQHQTLFDAIMTRDAAAASMLRPITCAMSASREKPLMGEATTGI